MPPVSWAWARIPVAEPFVERVQETKTERELRARAIEINIPYVTVCEWISSAAILNAFFLFSIVNTFKYPAFAVYI